MTNLFQKIQIIMGAVFEMPAELITIESNQKTIENWDSLRHLNLVVSLEEELEITFPEEEIGNLNSVENILRIINEYSDNK